MSQTFQMLFGRGRHRTNSRSLTNDRGELNTHIPDGPHMTVRQLRRMLDNNLFEAELNPRDENSIPTVERPVVAQNPYSATSESERAGPNEVGALMESNVCSDAPKQTGQMHLLSTFSDVHGGLARLVFELSWVLCGLGDNQEKLMDDYSHVVHECTNFMLDAAIKLQHLQTNLQFSGATPCDAARRTWLNTNHLLLFGVQVKMPCVLDESTAMTPIQMRAQTVQVNMAGRLHHHEACRNQCQVFRWQVAHSHVPVFWIPSIATAR